MTHAAANALRGDARQVNPGEKLLTLAADQAALGSAGPNALPVAKGDLDFSPSVSQHLAAPTTWPAAGWSLNWCVPPSRLGLPPLRRKC